MQFLNCVCSQFIKDSYYYENWVRNFMAIVFLRLSVLVSSKLLQKVTTRKIGFTVSGQLCLSLEISFSQSLDSVGIQFITESYY